MCGLQGALSSSLLPADATVQHGTMCAILYIESKLSVHILTTTGKLPVWICSPAEKLPQHLPHRGFQSRTFIPLMLWWSCSGGGQWRDVIALGSSQLRTCLTAWMLSRACMLLNLPGGFERVKEGKKQTFLVIAGGDSCKKGFVSQKCKQKVIVVTVGLM